MMPNSFKSFPITLQIGLGIYILLMIISSKTNVIKDTATGAAFGFVLLIGFALIAVGAVQSIARSQKISSYSVLLKVFMYMFLPAICGTILLVSLGYIFHWPGINPQ